MQAARQLWFRYRQAEFAAIAIDREVFNRGPPVVPKVLGERR
jgi:hypothetical protein